MAVESQFSAADVPVTATCSSYQHAGDFIIAPFLQRACNRQPADSPWNDKLAEGRYLYGATNQGELAVMRPHNRLGSLPDNDPKMDYFATHTLVSGLNQSKNIGSSIPFCTLFSSARLRDLKTTAWHRQHQSPSTEPSQEEAMLKRLYDQGLDGNISGAHILDDARAFRGFNSSAPRCQRFIPLETQQSYDKNQNQGYTQYSFFTMPAFGVRDLNLHDDV
jgi:hypothetical protein